MTTTSGGEILSVDWSQVWAEVAARFASHRAAGREPLLTEHNLRWETIAVLEEHGLGPARLAVEYRAPALVGGSLDLVVDPPDGTVIEFKFPRDSSTGISADTMTFGELLKDFLRVSLVPAHERWVVQLLNPRLQRYLKGASSRSSLIWADEPGEMFELRPSVLAALPKTARDALGSIAPGAVRALCTYAIDIDDGLRLIAYQVDAAGAVLAERPAAATVAPRGPAVVAPRVREGARFEILRAARAVTARSGATSFVIPEIIAEMRSRGSTYAESTIRTMIVAHLCADSTGDGVAPYDDLVRVERGRYQLRR